MKIKLSSEAKQILIELENYVERNNTKGAGKRFIIRFKDKIRKSLSTANYPICKYPKFAALGFKCIFINDWTIAFENDKDLVVIRIIIHGSFLSY
jgi:hypothetical protein